MPHHFVKKLLPLLVSLACASSGAADYYVVTPVKGKTHNVSGITVTLMASTLPSAAVGETYSYNLSQVLSVTGDPSYTGYGVKWDSVGNLPAGLSLNMYTGVLSGTPTEASNNTFDVTATYKTKTGTQTYTLTVTLKEPIPRWDSTTLDFGATTPYYEVTRTIKLHNDGSANGNWTSLSGVSGNVTADASGCAAVSPKQFCTVTFKYLPTAVGSLSLSGIKPSGATMAELSLSGSAGQRLVAVSPAVGGKTTWNLDVDGPLALSTAGTWIVTPTGPVGLNLKLWGAGGGGGGFDAAPVYSGTGGGGSFVNGYYRADQAITLVVGGGGAGGASNAVGTGGGAGGSNGGGKGGSAGTYGSSGGGGGGGGRTEALAGSTQIACAGGGGGGGGDGNATTNGNTHGNYFSGYTVTKDGGSAINRTGDGGGPGGGGGGCNGGDASGNFPVVDSNGEGGSAGQSTAPGLTNVTITPAAVGVTPARSTDPDLGTTNARGGTNAASAATAGSGNAGKIVIR